MVLQVVYDASEVTVSELVKAVADCGFETELLHKASASQLQPDEVLKSPGWAPPRRSCICWQAFRTNKPLNGPKQRCEAIFVHYPLQCDTKWPESSGLAHVDMTCLGRVRMASLW